MPRSVKKYILNISVSQTDISLFGQETFSKQCIRYAWHYFWNANSLLDTKLVRIYDFYYFSKYFFPNLLPASVIFRNSCLLHGTFKKPVANIHTSYSKLENIYLHNINMSVSVYSGCAESETAFHFSCILLYQNRFYEVYENVSGLNYINSWGFMISCKC